MGSIPALLGATRRPIAATLPLRVGLEASDALNGHRALGRYSRELPLALLRAAFPGRLDLRLLFLGKGALGRSRGFLSTLRRAGPAHGRALPLGKVLHFIWSRSRLLPVERLLGPLDIVHALSFLTPPAGPRARTVLTMHGAASFVRPDLLPQGLVREAGGRWTHYLGRADWLVSVSESARREFLERFEFAPERVRTIPPGVSPEFRPLDPEEVDRGLRARFGPGIERPYILFVGGLERVKNAAGLIDAFRLLVERRRVPHRLVLAGPFGNASEVVRRALRDGVLAERVLFTGHLPPSGDDLPLLYNGADLLVQPSFYEGWALPPLEAMACGTPVVASSASSLPETCGDAAVYADPADREAIASAMERALTDQAVRVQLRRRGLARSARWSWARCARETLALYREAAQAGSRPRLQRLVCSATLS